LARDSAIASSGFLLANFVPFRLNRLADAVSQDLSEIYRDRFGLEIPEWRVLVTVGQRRDCTAQHVAASTRMHKTRVSRAVASLTKRKLIERIACIADGRELRLRLTKAGRKVYEVLVSLALERERALLAKMSHGHSQAFVAALAQLEGALRLNDDRHVTSNPT
jgi:DNA-binding MarR family transcriptional regulator